MATYRGLDVPDHLHAALPHMRLVEETREALMILGQQWDLLDVLSRVVKTETEVDRTRTEFQSLNTSLITALGEESLDKLVRALVAKAQVSVDIVIRNLFERTADIGFLATDDDLRRFLKKDDAMTPHGVRARLNEYRSKYSVYENVVVMDATGAIKAQSNDDALPAICRDRWVGRALSGSRNYVETFAPSDLSPGGRPALIYAACIVEADGPGANPLGLLALLFRFADELHGIFRKLLAPDDWTILVLLDADGVVLASSDVMQMPVGCRLTVDTKTDYEFIRYAGRRYIAATRATKGYQGYAGPGWRGCALIPMEVAFEEKGDAEPSFIDRHYRAIASNPELFSDAVRHIPRRADAIQAELNRTVWNGKLAMSRPMDITDPAADEAAARRALLSEISAAGSRTQRVFGDAVRTLNRTAIGSIVENCAFSAALAVDLMDRNLYERANDCRWWALTSRFRELLSGLAIDDAARAEMTAILVAINDLYTVYTNLLLFDRQGVIQAVSDAGQAALVGTILSPDLMRRFTARADTAYYGVSDFTASAMYNDRATYIYGAPILMPTDPDAIVGGIAIVFDGEPQLRAMLDDAALFQTAGRLTSGSRNLFVDRQCRIIASTNAEDVIGSTVDLPADLFAQARDRSAARILTIGGELFAAGTSASVGYREYKGPRDAYANEVYAVSLVHLSADTAGEIIEAPRPRALPDSSSRPDHAARRELATFAIGESHFAFDRDDIVEAILPDRIAPAPGMPACVVGYASHRAGIIMILDPRDHLGLSSPARETPLPVVVFREGERLLGLQVDVLGEIFDIDADRASNPDVGHAPRIVKAFVKADTKGGGGMLMVLDVQALTRTLLSSASLS